VRLVALIVGGMSAASCVTARLHPYRLLDGAPFPAARAADVHAGMTEGQVRAALGVPLEVLTANGDPAWRYYERAQARWCGAGTLGVQRPEYTRELRVFFRHGLVVRTSADRMDGRMTGPLEAPTRAAAPAPTLSAEVVGGPHTRGAPILVRVTLTNEATHGNDHSRFFVLVPRLTFGDKKPDWPTLQVAFDVTGPDGRALVPTPKETFPRLAEPQVSWFDELHAGEFFGRTVDLTAPWLGFAFPTSGTYTVRATLTTGARRWLDGWLLRNNKDRADLRFSYDDVFEGTLAAPPAQVLISE
jgi:hypothetical protein